MADDLVDMGRVIDAYGVRGQLKLEPFAGPDSALASARRLWLCKPDKSAEFGVRQIKPHSGNLLVSLEGFADRDFAASWKGATVRMSREQFPPSEEDEYYWVDLIGCQVSGRRASCLGEVVSVDDHGGGPFLRIRALSGGATGTPRERLIPFVANYVTRVDLDNRLIEADWDPDWD